jgi:REP element-mobilizing transposase RayT
MYRSSRRIAIYKSQDPRLRKQFGGALLKRSNAKKARPISTKHAMHVVLHSNQAKGAWSFRHHKNWKRISEILSVQARRYGVQLREVVNGGDHLQLILKIKNRELFNSFVRAISGIIAMTVTGAAKTRALKEKFWDFRPWSRVVALIRKYSVQADETVQKYLVEAKIFNFKEAPA